MADRYLITGGGSVTWDASNTAIWSASSGGATGASVPVDGDDVIMDANSGGGTVTLGYNPTVTSITGGAFTGTFDASTFSPTMDTFNFSGTGTRTLNMGSGTWTIRGSGTIWGMLTTTNLTFSAGTSTVNFTNTAGVEGNFGSLVMNDVNVTASTGIIHLNLLNANNLSYLGSTGSIGSLGSGRGNTTVRGSLVLGINMAPGVDGGHTFTFTSTSGVQTITSNGTQLSKAVTFNGVGGTWQLNDDISLISNKTITLTNGTFNANNFNVTCGVFSSNNGNTRVFNMGSGTLNLTGTGTILNFANQTGLTVNSGSSTIKVTNQSASTKTLSTKDQILNNLWFTGGTGALIMGTQTSGASYYNNFRVDPVATVQFLAGATYNFNSLTWSGTIGNINTFESTTGGVAWNIVSANGVNTSQDYISLQDSAASGATFWAGANSTDVSGNTGWTFAAAPVVPAGLAGRRSKNYVGVAVM